MIASGNQVISRSSFISVEAHRTFTTMLQECIFHRCEARSAATAI
jgi:hypothetical protein